MFYGCEKLTNIFIPNNVNSIGYEAFYGCSGELTINCSIPDAKGDYHNPGAGVFYGCSSLKSVILSENIRYIEDDAFIRRGTFLKSTSKPLVKVCKG